MLLLLYEKGLNMSIEFNMKNLVSPGFMHNIISFSLSLIDVLSLEDILLSFSLVVTFSSDLDDS